MNKTARIVYLVISITNALVFYVVLRWILSIGNLYSFVIAFCIFIGTLVMLSCGYVAGKK